MNARDNNSGDHSVTEEKKTHITEAKDFIERAIATRGRIKGRSNKRRHDAMVAAARVSNMITEDLLREYERRINEK